MDAVALGDEDSYGDWKNLKVLLLLQVLVRGHKYVKLAGREGVTMAQRFPNDFDGIFSRVPAS